MSGQGLHRKREAWLVLGKAVLGRRVLHAARRRFGHSVDHRIRS